jgi:hypothetical protein
MFLKVLETERARKAAKAVWGLFSVAPDFSVRLRSGKLTPI